MSEAKYPTPLAVRVAASVASRRKYPERQRARSLVFTALRNGTLIRPDRCERCGVKCVPEASHDDYSIPLLVEWLCRQCHVIKDRPTSCHAGHPFDEANTRLRGNTQHCRACARERQRRYRAEQKGQS